MKIAAGLIILLAVVIAVVPQLTDCLSQGRSLQTADGRAIPMKCHWTAQAELALALPLVAAGGLLLFSRRKESQRNLGITTLVLGAVSILIPTALIGVCASNQMLCNSVMQPVLILGGTLAIAAGLAVTALSRRTLEVAA